MWSILVITCIIFQTSIAIFLLNGVRRKDDLDKQLRAMLIILLVHLSTKFLLLAVLKDQFLYAQMPTGFGLAYGPLLLVIARSLLGRPMRPRSIVLQFCPFLFFSLIYVFLVIAGARGAIARPAIAGYAARYEWLVIVSLYSYPIYVKFLLRRGRAVTVPQQLRLTRQMANVLLLGITMGLTLSFLHWTAVKVPGFDLRMLPYICFSAIPVLILRYRLQETGAQQRSTIPEDEPVAVAQAIIAEEKIATGPAQDRRYEKSGLDAGKMGEYEAALAAFMRKSKIYLDPDLSLEGLASRMKMSKHHLTQLLNERIMKNFYSFINEYRIAEAVDRLNNPALQVNILSLAFDCGFNSRSSFNSYFKKITGHTPSAYRKMALEKSRLIRDTSPSA